MIQFDSIGDTMESDRHHRKRDLFPATVAGEDVRHSCIGLRGSFSSSMAVW